MKIKIIEFFSVETDLARLSLVYISILSGICYGLLIFIINNAANLVFQDIALEIPLAAVYATLCVVFYFCQNYSISRSILLAAKIIGNIRLRLIDKIRHSELVFIEKTGPTKIHSQLTQDITTISQAVPVLINTLEDLVTVIVIYLYIAIVSIEAFIVIVFFIGVTIVYFYSGYFKIKNEMIKATIKETQFFGILKGVLKGFKQIKMNSKKNDDLFLDIDQVSKKSEAYKVQSLLTFREHSMNILSLYLVMYGTLLFILPIYVEDVRLNILKIFSALLFAAGPFEMVFRSIATIAMTNVAVDNLRRLEDKLDQTEKTDLDPLDLQTDFKQITLSDVRFNYTDKDGNITFQSGPIDLTVQKGEILFIVGGNGSGKSTLLKLLTGIYKPLPPGQILLDNTPVIQQTYPSYRELFSIIFTDYYLFKKIYGLESIDEKKLREWLVTMQLHTKTKFKDGQFTNTDLSTGQRKRLACIEALLEDKPIYVFDEWTADQDPVFRKFLYDTILKDLKAKGKTIIVVSHDDRYFDRADKVIVMEEGRIIS